MLTIKQAADELGITFDRLYRLLREGRVRGKKVDGIWQIEEVSVIARQKFIQDRNRKRKS